MDPGFRRDAAFAVAAMCQNPMPRTRQVGFPRARLRQSEREEDSAMKYDVISADCHVDLIWLPPDLFTANASAAFKERMPYVADGPRGREWVTKNGPSFGLDCGMGSAGRLYEPRNSHRSAPMASTGLYDPKQQKIRRLTNPDLRLEDQERDGIQAE